MKISVWYPFQKNSNFLRHMQLKIDILSTIRIFFVRQSGNFFCVPHSLSKLFFFRQFRICIFIQFPKSSSLSEKLQCISISDHFRPENLWGPVRGDRCDAVIKTRKFSFHFRGWILRGVICSATVKQVHNSGNCNLFGLTVAIFTLKT